MLFIVPFEYSQYVKNYKIVRKLDATSKNLVAPQGPAYSIYFEDKYLGSVGFFFPYKGVAIVWMVTTIYVEEYPKEFIKACWEIFNFQTEADGIWRMECKVPDIPKFQKFVEKFGFEREGLAKHYGPNKENYHHYAWIRENQPEV